MAELTPEKRSQLKASHGDDCRLVEAPTGPVVFRKPTRQEWDRYQDTVRVDPGKASALSRELQTACLLHPSFDEYMAALDNRPAILGDFQVAINELAGLPEDYPPQKL